jgi:hypothetical protein
MLILTIAKVFPFTINLMSKYYTHKQLYVCIIFKLKNNLKLLYVISLVKFSMYFIMNYYVWKWTKFQLQI